MRIICFVLALLLTTTLARAEDAAALISQYRRAHGLSSIVVWKVGYRYVLCLIKNVLKPRLQNPAGDVHAAQERYRVRWDRQRPGERSDHEPAGVRQAVPVSPPTTPR